MKFKTLVILAFMIFPGMNVIAQVTDTMTLVWQDEFDGKELDDTKWQTCPEWKRQGFSYWEDENYHLTDSGQLRLDITQRGDSVFCGAIRTKFLYYQKFGYFELRCKVPQIRGGWCAFWMMPDQNNVGDAGKDGTEIDIFESINGWQGTVNHAVHWDGYGPELQSDAKSMQRPDIYDDAYHTFGMLWTPTEYVFYIDNVETWRTSAGGVSQVKQYMKLTMEVTDAAWAGDWNDQTEKPIHWYIDYVRVYQPGTATSANPRLDKGESKESGILTFPNPSNGILTINGKSQDNTEYNIISTNGQTMQSGKIDITKNQIDISALPPSTYILKIGQQQTKIIKL